MRFEEYCEVREVELQKKPETWRTRKIRLAAWWDSWKRRRRAWFRIPWPVLSFFDLRLEDSRWLYHSLTLLLQNHHLKREPDLGKPFDIASASVPEILKECRLMATLLLRVRPEQKETARVEPPKNDSVKVVTA